MSQARGAACRSRVCENARMNRKRFFGGALLAASSVFAAAPVFEAGRLTIEKAWSRPTVAGMPMGVAYFDVTNHGKKPDVLLSASTPAADSVEFHRSSLEDGMVRMRPAGKITIPPGATVKVEPEGLHLMLVGLKHSLVAGSQVPLTLTFESAGSVTVQLMVRTPAM